MNNWVMSNWAVYELSQLRVNMQDQAFVQNLNNICCGSVMIMFKSINQYIFLFTYLSPYPLSVGLVFYVLNVWKNQLHFQSRHNRCGHSDFHLLNKKITLTNTLHVLKNWKPHRCLDYFCLNTPTKKWVLSLPMDGIIKCETTWTPWEGTVLKRLCAAH